MSSKSLSTHGSNSSLESVTQICSDNLPGANFSRQISHTSDFSRSMCQENDVAISNLERLATRNTILETLEKRMTNIACENGSDVDEDGMVPYRTKSGALNEATLPTKDDGAEFAAMDPDLVTWNGEDDPENPVNWSPRNKYIATSLVSMYAFASPFASSILSPAVEEISHELHVTSSVISAMMVSIFLLAFALGPLLISAPLSEMYGRKIVMDVSSWFMFFFTLGCAFSKTSTQLLVCRFFAGIGGSSPLALGAGSISDMFQGPGKYGTKMRPIAIALFSIGPCAGPCVSTLISGYIVERAGWRWVFYVMAIFNFCLAAFGTVFYRETYAPALLARKKNRLIKETGNTNLKTIYEIANLETTFGKFEVNLTRPLRLLTTHPLVFGVGLFMAVCYGCLYILITAFPAVWRESYHIGTGNTGLMYISLLLGYGLGIFVWAKINFKLFGKLTQRNGGVAKPEFRLPPLLVSSILQGVGLLIFGWGVDTTYKKHPIMWFLPEFGAFLFAFGIIAMFQGVQNYLVDMNPRFAASAVAAAAFFRSLFGFIFPLFAPKMFDRLGYGVGCSIFGAIAFLTGIPFPLFLIYRGEGLRKWANKRMEIRQANRDAMNLDRIKKENEKQMDIQRRLLEEHD